MDVTWDLDSGFTTRTYRETVPLKVSDPSVFQDYAATAEAWAKIGVEFEIHPTAPDIASISVALSGQATASAALAPLENPWWTLDMGIDVRGDVGLALDFGIAEVPDAGTDFDFKHFNLASFDAGGPLIGGGAMKPKGPTAPGAEPVLPLSGNTVRWARTLATSAGGENGGDYSYNLPLSDGSTVCIWKGGMFCRLTAEGDLLWMKLLSGAFGGVALGQQSHPGWNDELPDRRERLQQGPADEGQRRHRRTDLGDRTHWAAVRVGGGSAGRHDLRPRQRHSGGDRP